MANARISELPNSTTTDGSAVIPVVEAGANRKGALATLLGMTAFGRSILQAADAAGGRAALGAQAAGRYWPARRIGANEAIWPAGVTQTPSNANVIAGRLVMVPYDLQETATLIRLGWYLAAAAPQATNIRMGLYSVDDALLATLLLDAGETAVANGQAIGEVFSPAPFSLQRGPGRIWAAYLASANLTGASILPASPLLDLPAMASPGVASAGMAGLTATVAYGASPASQQMAALAVGVPTRPAVMGLYVGSVP